MVLARDRRERILVTASKAAKECLSLMLPLLPKSFSTVSACALGDCALGNIAFMIPPFQISNPVAWMPSGENVGPMALTALFQLVAKAVNLGQA